MEAEYERKRLKDHFQVMACKAEWLIESVIEKGIFMEGVGFSVCTVMFEIPL